MMILKSLTTSRKTYEDVIAFDNMEEATNNGFHFLYRDEASGCTIYGKPLDPMFPKVCRVAVILDAGRRHNF